MKKANSMETKKTGIHSIRVSISILIILTVAVTAVLNIASVRPSFQKHITEITDNYLLDLALGYGQIVDNGCAYGSPEEVLVPERLQTMLADSNVAMSENSYAYVVGFDGNLIYHPSAEKIGQPVDNDTIKEVLSNISAGTAKDCEVIRYSYNGVKKYGVYYVGKSADFILVINAEQSEVLAPVQALTVQCIITALISLVLSLVLCFAVVGRLTNPIITITSLIERLANLDFTIDNSQVQLNGRLDETGNMSRAITRLREELGNVIYDLQQQSRQLYEFTAKLNNNTQQTIRTVGQVERAAQDIAAGATSQANETEQATGNVVTIGNMVEATNEKVGEIHSIVMDMQKNGDDAAEQVHQLDVQNEKTKSSIQTIYEQTNITNQSAEKIREATVLIASIAEETSLLSLNASIEAARAGEQGRGFAVVAAQIQKLAEQSNESTAKIEDIVSSLIEDSQKAVVTMEEVKNIVEEQSHAVERTEAIFSHVQKGIQNTKQGVDAIAEHTYQMDTARINVVDVVQNLTAIAEENAASTEETSASITQVSSIMEEIAADIGEVKDVAQKLEENINKFRL